MNAAWLVNRLRAMSPAEIAWRVLEQGKRYYSRRRLEGVARYRDDNPSPPILPGITAQFSRVTPAERVAISAAAELALSGNFSALGVTWPPRQADDLFPADIWQIDPVTGRRWPTSDYCFDISYRHNREIGDVKYVWEFGRLQNLQALSAHWVLTRDARALAAVEAAIISFDAANPPFRGVHYAEILNVAIRSINILMATSLCNDALSPKAIAAARQMLRSHARWLALFPSRFSSANNHLVAELAAEYMIGVALGDAARHTDRCWHHLVEEAGRQILPDGINAEQSPAYGAYTAEFLLLAALVARGEGRAIPSVMQTRLVGFATHIGWLADANGCVPNLCDNDEGRVITLCAAEPQYPLSVAAAICGFFTMPLAAAVAPEATLRSALFAARPAIVPAPLGARVFSDGGLSVVRGTLGEVPFIFTFDHGPLGYLAIAAHGHADALSITLTLDNRPVLVDPGTYLYHSGGAWRDWFRGTRAHNTLTLAGRDQSTIAGPFNWSQKAKAWLISATTGNDWAFVAAHDGYAKTLGITHERTVAAASDGILLHDRLIGTQVAAAEEIELVFQCAPDISVELDHTLHTARLVRDGRDVAALCFTPGGQIEVASGGKIGTGGWVSQKFGEKAPAARIVWIGVMPPAGIDTMIRFGAA